MLKDVSIFLMITGGVLFAGYLLVYHYRMLGRILARAIGGTAAIIIINYLLSMVGIHNGVGVNVYTILAVGFLGSQGLLFLYVLVGFLALFY